MSEQQEPKVTSPDDEQSRSTVGLERIYIPKGGMCCTCTKLREICNSLPFETMPTIGTTAKGEIIVRCTEHDRVRSNVAIEALLNHESMSAETPTYQFDHECQYADVPPDGYKVIDFHAEAKEGDMAYHQKHGGVWRPVRRGQNIIGASAHELWSGVMAIARKLPSTK